MHWTTWLLLVLVPALGWLIWTRLPPGRDEPEDPLEMLFAALVCGVLATGWAALLLAELGALAPAPLVAILVASCALLLWRIRRRAGPLSFPAREEAISAVFVIALAAASVAPASENVLGGRDPGVYANTAAWLAQRGTIEVHSGALEDVGPSGRHVFFREIVMPGFYVRRAAEGEIAPQFFHLHPTYMALGYWIGGPRGALLVPPFFGVLAIAAVFFFTRRLLGIGPAVIAAALLTLNLAQMWAARNPYSEPSTQFAVFTSLWCLAAATRHQAMRWGLVAGAALGTCALIRIDAALLLIAIAPALVVLQALKPERQTWITRAFLPIAVALFVWGGLHGWLFSRPYVWALRRPTLALWLTAAVVVILCSAVLARPRPTQAIGSFLRRHAARLWMIAAVLAGAAFIYGMWIRPELGPFETLRSGRRTYVEETMVRVAWYLSTPGMIAGLGGFLLIVRSALVRRQAEWMPFAAAALAFSMLYFADPRIHPDHPWMMRRFVPVIVPAICVAITAGVTALWTMPGRWRAGTRMIGAGILAAVLLHEGAMSRPFWSHTEQEGTIDRLASFAKHVPERGILLFNLPGTEQRAAAPLAFVWRREVLPVIVNVRSDPQGLRREGRFEAQIIEWLSEGRVVQYLTAANSEWAFLTPNVSWEPVATLELDAPIIGATFESPPRRPWRYRERFHLVRATLGAERVRPCAATVFPLEQPPAGTLQGFYRMEGRRMRFRWATPRSRILVPACDRTGSGRPGAVRIRARCPRPEGYAPCEVAVSVNGRRAGVLTLTRAFADYSVPVPPAAVAEPIGSLDIHFRGPAYLPSEHGARDERTLSFQIGRIAIEGIAASNGSRHSASMN